jgi:hypothetical protein
MSLQENLVDAWWHVPPLTRYMVTATVALSVPIQVGLLSAEHFYHSSEFLLRLPPHIWRPVTAFFVTGPQLSLIFEPYFLYRYMMQMEMGSPRFPRREDVLWYLIFVGSIILVSRVLAICAILVCPASVFSLLLRLPGSQASKQTTPHHYCPDSALPPQLSRFLKMRKMTPALRPAHLFALRAGSRCRHGGMSYGWLV